MTGLGLRLPLIIGAFCRELASRIVTYARTYRRRIDLLDGKLSLFFLGGWRTDLVPLLFGEKFTMVLYDGVAVDPGSPPMRRSLARHLRRLPLGSIGAVVATHHHEEHVGNLNWLARQTGAPLYVPDATAQIIGNPPRLPLSRRLIIGQPDRLEPPFELLGQRLATATGYLEVLPAPGHCDDQVVLYDRERKVLLAGDAFMGTYFSAPNPDVDSRQWIETLERLLKLDIETFVEGHGHVHTLRPDVPDIPGVIVRRDPKAEMREKLQMLLWVRDQIERGRAEGLPPGAVRATCFPWNRRWAWEQFLNDEMVRLLTLGHFSRSEMVRSFVREPGAAAALPTVYEVEIYRRGADSSSEPRNAS